MVPPVIRTILYPTDLSTASLGAFEHVRVLAARFQAHVTLYHALEMPGRAWIRAAGHEETLRRRMAAEAALELERLARGLTAPHQVVVEPDVSAPPALVDVALLRLVQSTQPDLVVMATHSRGAMATYFLGSVTQQVLRDAARPVLAVGPGCPTPDEGYRRIVLPTDFSEASRAAFPVAGLLASAFGAEVIAVHVVPRPVLTAPARPPRALPPSVPSADALREFVADLAGARVTPRVVEGAAWDRIAALARDEQADLIVMASQGADSLGDRILGSQTERVIRHASCPVLAARHA